jgi:hypothetical protein
LTVGRSRDCCRERFERVSSVDVSVRELHDAVSRLVKHCGGIRSQSIWPDGIEAISVENEDERGQRPVLALPEGRRGASCGRSASGQRMARQECWFSKAVKDGRAEVVRAD